MPKKTETAPPKSKSPKPAQYPTPHGAKAQNNKSNKMQAAYQKRNNQKGR